MIRMQINTDKIYYLVGSQDVLENAMKTPALPMFSEVAVEFLSKLSQELIHDKRVKYYPDVMSYAYWIRKSSLTNAMNHHFDKSNRIGRGVAFHVAPSNVPVNFAVSMTSSILAGNVTIVRVSNKEFEQVNIICDAMNRLLKSDFEKLYPYFGLIRYEHNDEITQMLSGICDVRIIWGGNRTIESIRRAVLPPRSIEMTFADRHSIAIIDSEYYLKQDYDKIAKEFYTDTYYTDQNACSSPRLVVWVGKETMRAREIFWRTLDKLVKSNYNMKPIQAIEKYSSLCALGMKYEGVDLVSNDNYITRVEVDNLFPELMNYKNSGGYFFEYCADNLEEIIPVLTKECQTISVLGIEKADIKDLVFSVGSRGVDRIVTLGQTMGLEFVWDGFKMIEGMSRILYVGEA